MTLLSFTLSLDTYPSRGCSKSGPIFQSKYSISSRSREGSGGVRSLVPGWTLKWFLKKTSKCFICSVKCSLSVSHNATNPLPLTVNNSSTRTHTHWCAQRSPKARPCKWNAGIRDGQRIKISTTQYK